MKKTYIQPDSLAIALATESVMTSTSELDITGTSGSSSTDGKITSETGESGFYTNREKPGAGLWE